jgi:hypothetical protein
VSVRPVSHHIARCAIVSHERASQYFGLRTNARICQVNHFSARPSHRTSHHAWVSVHGCGGFEQLPDKPNKAEPQIESARSVRVRVPSVRVWKWVRGHRHTLLHFLVLAVLLQLYLRSFTDTHGQTAATCSHVARKPAQSKVGPRRCATGSSPKRLYARCKCSTS